MIIIYEQDITHYRASFYDFLSTQIDEELVVLYGTGEPQANHIMMESHENRLFASHKIKRYWFGKKFYFNSPSHLKQFSLAEVSGVIHRGAIRNIGLLREINFFKKKGIPVVVRGQGFSRNRIFDPEKNVVDKLHKKIVDSSDSYLCYTAGDKHTLKQFVSENKIVVGINTLNTELLNEHFSFLGTLGQNAVKEELNLSRNNYLCYIGRLSKRKKIDVLLETYARIRTSRDVGLIIIGDGDYEKELKQKVKDRNLPDVIFTGALSPDSVLTSKYIYSSNAVVIPGWLGLAVNHAFFLGKPVVGYIKENSLQGHGPEAEFLVDGYNGILSSALNVEGFEVAIEKVFENLEEYSNNARRYGLENLTVQKMAEGYITALRLAKNKYKINNESINN